MNGLASITDTSATEWAQLRAAHLEDREPGPGSSKALSQDIAPTIAGVTAKLRAALYNSTMDPRVIGAVLCDAPLGTFDAVRREALLSDDYENECLWMAIVSLERLQHPVDGHEDIFAEFAAIEAKIKGRDVDDVTLTDEVLDGDNNDLYEIVERVQNLPNTPANLVARAGGLLGRRLYRNRRRYDALRTRRPCRGQRGRAGARDPRLPARAGVSMSAPHALNYTPKAVEALLSYPAPDAPLTRQGFRYIADKLRQAQVFVLPDFGMLLDRSKPRPQVDTLVFKPPFDVVALEFTGDNPGRSDPYYTAATSTRRIALAWDWKDDLVFAPKGLGPGVVIASIAFYDNDQAWMPIMGAYHIPYDAKWGVPEPSQFAQRMVEIGGMTPAQARAPAPGGTPVPLLPEVMLNALKSVGNAGLIDLLQSDLSDEVAAYMDLCCALACRNVEFERHAAPAKLNKARIASGKLPLPDHHTLTLNGGEYGGGASGQDRLGPRSHLRRGHIRRLASGRITWVNQTMVNGQREGFVTKTYRMKGRS